MAETVVFQNAHISCWVSLKFQEGGVWLGPAWHVLMGDCAGRLLVDLPGQPPPSTSVAHPNLQGGKEKRWQASRDGHGAID